MSTGTILLAERGALHKHVTAQHPHCLLRPSSLDQTKTNNMNTVLTYITPSTNVIWERSKKQGTM